MWHPLSTLLLEDPPTWAAPGVVRLLLRGGGALGLLYSGDRMWPTLRHRQRVRVTPLAGEPAVGEIVLAVVNEIPELLRVAGRDPEGGVLLIGDADPLEPAAVASEAILGRVAVGRVPTMGTRRFRRLRRDLREAWSMRPDGEAEQSVRRKYDGQAVHYARGSRDGIESGLAEWLRTSWPPGGRVLVVGSGAGRECFALSREGWSVTGVDFSQAMVEHSLAAARDLRLPVEFLQQDIRRYREDPGSLSGVLFTYDAYSFLHSAEDRIAVLTHLRESLAPGGAIFISARRVRGLYPRALLTCQWLAGRGGRRWGDSHTRYIVSDGGMHRSFVRLFTARQLRQEATAAGLQEVTWRGGHGLLQPRVAESPLRSDVK